LKPACTILIAVLTLALASIFDSGAGGIAFFVAAATKA
jgi:hypothetical protein